MYWGYLARHVLIGAVYWVDLARYVQIRTVLGLSAIWQGMFDDYQMAR